MYVAKCADNTLYTGITSDPDRRLHEHNNTKKGAKYTRSRRPIELVYCVSYPDRSTASKAEAAFKKLSRKQKLNIIDYSEVKEGDLIWQRRLPGGVCVIIEMWDSWEEYKKQLNERLPKAGDPIWTKHDFPVYKLIHPSEGIIEDPCYYYETIEDQTVRHDRMVKMLADYLGEE
jgi:putative endonuclease